MNLPLELGPNVDQLVNQPANASNTDGPRLDGHHLALFAMLYAVQGIVISYFFTFNGRYMLASGFAESAGVKGLTIEQVGWTQTIATLPLAVKFLLGLWADRHNLLGLGHRVPYIILGLLMQSLGMLGLSLINPALHLTGFTVIATLTVIGLCIYDVSCDAFAVQVTPAADRSRVQGILQASRFVSAALFGVVFGLIWNLSPTPGRGVLWLCSVLPVPVLVYTLTVREPEHVARAEGFGWGTLRIFRQKSLWALLFFSVIYTLVSFGAESSLVFWFAVPSLAFSESALGFQSLGRNVGRAVGALSQARLARITSRRNLVAAGLLGLSAHCLAFGFVTGPQSAMLVGVLFGVTIGWLDAVACAMAMDEADPVWPASSFALIMAFQNLGTLGSGLMASLAQARGFPNAFAIVAAFNLLALAAWPLLDHKPKKPEQTDVWPV